jgi:hypothetical protein
VSLKLLEAKDGIQRMLVRIPLNDEERAAVESDQQAVNRLIDLLVDTPTPAGRAPRELAEKACPERLTSRDETAAQTEAS